MSCKHSSKRQTTRGIAGAELHVVYVYPAQATKKVATLALKIKQLKAFVHVSTAYVNCNLPRGSHIEEQIYPLYHKDGKKVEHKKLAIKLAAMPPNKAEAEVCSPLLC